MSTSSRPFLHLLIIDPQNDFCDLPPARCAPGHSPALPVSGADADMQRLGALIAAAQARIDAITLTLDSHHRLDIAHPAFWQDRDGGQVLPFTQITAAALRAGQFRPRLPEHGPRAQAYLDALEATGRYTLMVWPVHCEIGTWGHAVHDSVHAAYQAWEEQRQRSVHKLLKGSNPWTEHYSALQAEVPDAKDPASQLNRELLNQLAQADEIWVAGEASSHCVRATVEHLLQHLPQPLLPRISLLTDCMSPVAGFEAQQAEFFAAMRSRGLQLLSSSEAMR
ncbi:cysteine hydrolase [Paucibacter sp. KBW04]|uniref:isochorismatase family protein n=1 Tax=Paucibacter sp. KBW04 TaxID=2153361 RepID=UPI000F55A17C|nr:isochorismatase family protein [Paucibacter sp. KBW04]RQO57212.1 cysteine hydrolase [Paucibacter sp. KBW04]